VVWLLKERSQVAAAFANVLFIAMPAFDAVGTGASASAAPIFIFDYPLLKQYRLRSGWLG
jgi:hypothetical protein